jgi:hypothetical protein
MSKYQIVKVNDEGEKKVLKDDIRNIVYIAERKENNELDFGYTADKLKTEKMAFMKFIFDREMTKLLDSNYRNIDNKRSSNPSENIKRLLDMI